MKSTLDEYRRKRDFTITSEPAARIRKKSRAALLQFVIQMHAARRLHFDLRLEVGGVFKSWALTRRPSLDPEVKRLAVQVEDHPLAYGTFEGVIPKSQYGAGSVLIWDRGVWTPDCADDLIGQLDRGELKFSLRGEKLHGSFVLVRMKPRANERQAQWLMIAHKGSRSAAPPEIIDDRSVASRRTLEDIARGVPAPTAPTSSAALNAMPAFVEPSLCRLVSVPPASGDWGHQVKFDGYRLQVRVSEGEATIRSRSGLDWTHRFPALAGAARALPDCLLDGEAVLEQGGGSFAALHRALAVGNSSAPIRYMVFDCLFLERRDLRGLPLIDRQQALNRLTLPAPTFQTVETFHSDGPSVYRAACGLGLQGIVSKRLSAPYRSGRSDDWVKCICRQVLSYVIGGLVLDAGGRLKALLVGQREPEGLVFMGRVGTGFSDADRSGLEAEMRRWRHASSPFAPHPALKRRPGEELAWSEPVLVADVEAHGRTDTGLLRHASFKCLRPGADEAKKATSVMPANTSKGGKVLGVPITHPAKALWPATESEPPVTKMELAEYFAAAAPLLLAEIAGRPVSLLRCPEGIQGQHFFQRHPAPGVDPAIGSTKVDAGRRPYLQIDTPEGLAAAAQSAALELHPWNCAPGAPGMPGRLVFDLDPDADVPFERVVAAAHEVRQRLEILGLHGFCKTTGGKGLHVTAPLTGDDGSWAQAKAFALSVCRSMAADSPGLYTTTLAKRARRGRIFLDYLRNDRTATAVAAYSPRARMGATVSMPIGWRQVVPGLNPAVFTVRTVLRKRVNPWTDYADAARPLPKLT